MLALIDAGPMTLHMKFTAQLTHAEQNPQHAAAIMLLQRSSNLCCKQEVLRTHFAICCVFERFNSVPVSCTMQHALSVSG